MARRVPIFKAVIFTPKRALRHRLPDSMCRSTGPSPVTIASSQVRELIARLLGRPPDSTDFCEDGPLPQGICRVEVHTHLYRRLIFWVSDDGQLIRFPLGKAGSFDKNSA